MCRVLGLRVGRATGDPQQKQVDAAAGRVHAHRTQRGMAVVEIGLARPMRDPRRIAALFAKGRWAPPVLVVSGAVGGRLLFG